MVRIYWSLPATVCVQVAALCVVGVLFSAVPMFGQYEIGRDVAGGGGDVMQANNHRLRGTLSQTSIGRLQRATANRHNVGFWYKANVAKPSLCVRVADASAEPGTTLPVRLLLDSINNFPNGSWSFRARIRFNATLLGPVQDPAGSTPGYQRDGGDGSVVVEGQLATEPGSVLAEFFFLAKLGNAENTTMVLEEFALIGPGENSVEITRKDGLFTLLGVCREGGEIRLIHSAGLASRVVASPNPASGVTTVEFVANEKGVAQLTLVDALGREQEVLIEELIDAGRLYLLDVDVSSLNSGVYFLVFKTRTTLKTQRLVVHQ